jgi:hypothetical protein
MCEWGLLCWPQSTVHILVEMKQCKCFHICPLRWSVHCNFVHDDKCSERGWACTPHPHQHGLFFPSWWNIRLKAAVATLYVLWAVDPLEVHSRQFAYTCVICTLSTALTQFSPCFQLSRSIDSLALTLQPPPPPPPTTFCSFEFRQGFPISSFSPSTILFTW